MRCILLFILLISTACTGPKEYPAQIAQEQQLYFRLQHHASTDINLPSLHQDDSLSRLSREVESKVVSFENAAYRFKAGQMQANAYALAGNLALAQAKAQQLMDMAHEYAANPLIEGLALQAIGDTYLHTDRLAKADSIFLLAAPAVLRYGDKFSRIHFLLQQIHISLDLHKYRETTMLIDHARALLKEEPAIPKTSTYLFVLTYYEALTAIQRGDTEQATRLMEHVRRIVPATEISSPRLYALEAYYHLLAGDVAKSLAYADSTLLVTRTSSNPHVLRKALILKADLLDKAGLLQESAALYPELIETTNSLYQAQYISQIDSLHVTFWIDHLHTANITHRNELYAKLILGLLLVVSITLYVGLLIRRRNKLLSASRQELQKMREISSDSIRTKSLFLSNMSHELRTPLNGIMGFSTLLTENKDLDAETRRDCCSYIRQNADLLTKLINDVVDISSLKDNAMQFSYAPCDIVELCNNVVKTVESIKQTQAEISFVTDLQELMFVTDKNRLQQVLINLLVNATKFTPQGSITLRLHCDAKLHQAVFQVEDTGCGIPLEKQPRIFERFEKLHEGIQGSGLGLSICMLIVSHTGGRIWIDPQYTDGARFVFTHPLNLSSNQQQA